MGASILEPLFPYRHLDQDHLIRVSVRVCPRDKQRVASIIPDLGIHTLIVQTVYSQISKFIISNNLTYNDADQQRLLDFIRAAEFFDQGAVRGPAPVGASGTIPGGHVTGGATPIYDAPPSHANKRTDAGKSNRKGRAEKGEGIQVQGVERLRQVKGGACK